MISADDDFAGLLRLCRETVRPFSSDALAEFFGLPQEQFHRHAPGDPFVFHPGASSETAAMLLRGALFWPSGGDRIIVRSHPRIFPTSDFCLDRHQVLLENRLAAAAVDGGGELIAEPKLYGETIRVFSRGQDLYCATDVAYDGGNPLVGAGIDNSRGLGIDFGGQAAGILSQRYPRIERLTRLGYVALFVLQLPELAPDRSIDHADLVLVDVIDPDYVFADRLERERIAEDYKLTIVDQAAKIVLTSPEVGLFLKRCRAFEHQHSTPGSSGTVVKGRIGDAGDQVFCKVEPSTERERPRALTTADLSAVADEITAQFGETIWANSRIGEELMLEYLGTHHRSARRQVDEYLSAWRAARKLAGLA